MRASSLAEWKEAMKIRARVTSNFTYADRAGNNHRHGDSKGPDRAMAIGS